MQLETKFNIGDTIYWAPDENTIKKDKIDEIVIKRRQHPRTHRWEDTIYYRTLREGVVREDEASSLPQNVKFTGN